MTSGMNFFCKPYCKSLGGDQMPVPLIDWISDTLSQGCTNLQTRCQLPAVQLSY